MRKGQKKQKDVMQIKDHAMVKFWDAEQSPLFKESNHQFIDSIFTREPRLKNVRVQIRTMFDPATTEVYTSYELSLIEPEETIRHLTPLRVHPDTMPNVYTGDPEGKEIPNDRERSEPVIGKMENA